MFTTPGPLDFVAIARTTREFWDREQVFTRLVSRNRGGPRFSFIDGPITANNPMGIHHAWGRTAKDVIQRYKAMCGYDQRFQNGFDCQGLWVEVEVEKTLGFDSKREIESFGLERFSRACRERVLHFSGIQTEQSRKLGQWMDWPSSYFTMSDLNIEHNWHFLERCHERGWLYAGHRAMPWCARCGTSISQHEMLDAFADVTHESVTVAFPLADRPGHRLLVWTTTPWTLPANVAVAVHPALDYAECESSGVVSYVAAGLASRYPALGTPRRTVKGADLLGLRYVGPFDDLPAQRGVQHRVIPWDEVSAEDGTGLVHIAPGLRAGGLRSRPPARPARHRSGRRGWPLPRGLRPAGGRERARRRSRHRAHAARAWRSRRARPVPSPLPHLLAVRPGADLPPRGGMVHQRGRDPPAGPRRQPGRHLAPGPHRTADG